MPNLVDEIFGDAKGQDKKSKILNQVRGLLAQAESTPEPGEADVFRAKADQLMAVYALEQWEVDEAEAKGLRRPKPEVRYVDFHWFYNSNFREDLYSIFLNAARHCRVVIAHRGHGANEHSFYEIPLIGLSSDLDWFDLLFTSIMLQMGNQLEPKPDTNLTFAENAYRLRAAGMARPRVAKLLYDAGLIPNLGTGYYNSENERIEYYMLAPNKEKSLRAKVRVAGEKFGNDNGFDPTTTVNPQVWQRSFSDGFSSEIRRRLYSMRRIREDAPEMKSEDNHQAVALRDIYEMALELYNEQWPPPPPIEYKEDHGGSQKRRRVAMVKEVKMSGRAMAAGANAASKVNLSGHPSKGIGKRRELDK